jgi:arylsulfatase A-like enzyme
LPKGLEGASLVPVLKTNPAVAPKRLSEDFVVHFPHYDKDEIGPASALLCQNYKLIRVFETDQRLLFDLSKDPDEQTDLAAAQPDLVRSMDTRMTEYLGRLNAGLPTPNPNYDPNGERSGDRKGGGGGGGKGGKKGKMKP